MALLRLRLLCHPLTTQFSTQQLISFTINQHHKPPLLNSSLSLSTSHFSPLSLKTTKPNLFSLFVVSSTSQTQPQVEVETSIQSPPPPPQQQQQQEDNDDVSKIRLIAQNVPWSYTPDDLRPLFEKYGTVVDIELSMYNKNRNRGLAFVSMSSHEEALAALSNLESYELEGRTLKLAWANPRKEKPSSQPISKPVPIHNIFVANLPYQARSNDLREFFLSENFNVVSAEIIFVENPRRSAGYGFVSFMTEAEANTALAAFQGKMFMGRPLRVEKSKKFLRPRAKTAIHSENATSVSHPNTKEPAKVDDV